MDNLAGGSIVWNLDVKDNGFTAKTKAAEKSADDLADTVDKSDRKVGRSFANIGNAAYSASTAFLKLSSVAAVAAAGMVAFGVKTLGNLEAAEQGFVALLGSADEARDVMRRIKREAAATPFEITGLVSQTQALTAITKDGDKAVDILLDIGKAIATSGKGAAEMDRVIMNLQQVASTGIVTEMDIRQFQSAIPIFNDIIGAAGLTTEELKDSSNAAELLFDAFKKAGEAGGITARGFIAQAGTFNQLWSNLIDTVTIGTATFIETSGIFDAIKDSLQGLIDTINRFTTPESIETFMKFLSDNAPIIVGAITGALVPALVGIGIAAAKLAIVLLPLIAIGAVLGLIIKQLVERAGGWEVVWNEKILPILQKVADYIATTVVPIIVTLANWISTNLLPTLDKLWELFKTRILPVFQTFANYVTGTIIPALEAAYDKFNTYVLPVLQFLGEMIATYLVPQLERLVKNFKEDLRPILEKLWPALKAIGVVIGITIAASIAVAVGAIFVLVAALTAILHVVNFLMESFHKLRNTILDVLSSIANKISKYTDPIKKAMEKLNPFHRESPSLVDNVKKGVGVIQSQFDTLHLPRFEGLTSEVLPELDPITGGVSAVERRADTNANSAGKVFNINVGSVDSSERVQEIARAVQQIMTNENNLSRVGIL